MKQPSFIELPVNVQNMIREAAAKGWSACFEKGLTTSLRNMPEEKKKFINKHYPTS